MRYLKSRGKGKEKLKKRLRGKREKHCWADLLNLL
jgi:hypothetical protein